MELVIERTKDDNLLIPTLELAFSKVNNFREDLKLIQETQSLTDTKLAQALGVERKQVWRWKRGALPREPLTLLSILYWSECIRLGKLPI